MMRKTMLSVTCCCAIALFSGSCLSMGGIFYPRDMREMKEELARLREEKRVLDMRVNELQQDRFTLLALGDILLANEIDSALRRGGLGYPFEKIKEETARYNLVFANLEMPITMRGEPVQKKPYTFRLDPLNALSLLDLHLSVVSLANNHIMDFGPDGMYDTMVFLRDSSILHAGAGRNIQEARRPAELQHGITRVVILAYCERPPVDYYALADRPGIAPLDVKAVSADIARYRARNNVVLVSLHWGIEQTSMPKYYQRVIAHKIIDAGADGIIGHHPHWPQAVEMYRNRPVIYSLGNFINGFYNSKERDNLMAALYFDRNVLERVELIPLAGKNSEIGFQPYVMTGKAAAGHLREIQSMSRQLGTVIMIENDRGVLLPR